MGSEAAALHCRWVQLTEELSGSYSESGIACEVRRALDELWQGVDHLVRDESDLARLCRAAPGILLGLPTESEITPLGHERTYDLEPLCTRAQAATTLGEFLSAYEEPTTDEVPRFSERHAPSSAWANEGDQMRAELPYSTPAELKALLQRLGLRPDEAQAQEVEGVPVYVSVRREGQRNGVVELSILDPDRPYEITEHSRAMAAIVERRLAGLVERSGG